MWRGVDKLEHVEPLMTVQWQAKKEAKELGSLRNSILNGMGNVAGLLSEIVIADNYTSLMRNSTKNWDLIDEIRGKTYD